MKNAPVFLILFLPFYTREVSVLARLALTAAAIARTQDSGV
jgi:hypothetical protein